MVNWWSFAEAERFWWIRTKIDILIVCVCCLSFQPYRTTPLILPGAKVKRDTGPTECYLRHHPNPAMRANPHQENFHDILMKQKVLNDSVMKTKGLNWFLSSIFSSSNETGCWFRFASRCRRWSQQGGFIWDTAFAPPFINSLKPHSNCGHISDDSVLYLSQIIPTAEFILWILWVKIVMKLIWNICFIINLSSQFYLIIVTSMNCGKLVLFP